MCAAASPLETEADDLVVFTTGLRLQRPDGVDVARLRARSATRGSRCAVAGVHIVLNDAEQSLVGFAAVVPRTLRHNDLAFDTGYIEGVAVRADQQGLGLGRIVMDHAEHIVNTRHQLGALNAVETAAAFYEARGWRPWAGRTQASGPTGIIDTYDAADRIYLLSTEKHDQPFNAATDLICDWRPGHLW